LELSLLADFIDATARRETALFGVQIAPTICGCLQDLRRDPVGFRPGVFADPCHLPRDLKPSVTTGDLEAIFIDLLRDIDRREAADTGELITELSVEPVEPLGELNLSLAALI
jgi:hypothetical protein